MPAGRVARALNSENQRRLTAIKNLTQDLLIEFGPDLVGLLLPGASLIAKIGAFVAKKAGMLGGQPAPVTPTVFEEIDQGRIFEQYASVLRKLAAKHPLILALDDLQWVDCASADLLFYLGQRLAESRILLVGLYRPDEVALGQGKERDPLAKVIAELERKLGAIPVIDLDHAGVVEGRRFVDALLDSEPNCLGEEFRAALFQRTEGHPLFTVELLRMMREQGSLTHDAQGRCVTGADVNWDKLPARMEGLLDERVGRLDDVLKEALEVASVEGQVFTAQVVARAVKLDENHLLLRLSNDAERQHRLVEQQGEFTTDTHILTRFMFSHLLFQQHFYRLAGAARRALHGAVGALLEELYDGQTDVIAVQLARHFEEAMAWAKATEYLLRAGEQAQRIYACADAMRSISSGRWPVLRKSGPRRRRRNCCGRIRGWVNC